MITRNPPSFLNSAILFAVLANVYAGYLIRLRLQMLLRIDEEQLLTDANIKDDTQPRLNFSLGFYRVPFWKTRRLNSVDSYMHLYPITNREAF